MNIKLVKSAKNVEIVHVAGEKASMHRTTGDGNTVLGKLSNKVIDKLGGLDKVIKKATKINPKLKITVEDAPAT